MIAKEGQRDVINVQGSASTKPRSQTGYRLVSFIGQDDSDILPFFLTHYRALGVAEFHIFVHGDWTSAERAPLTASDVTIAGVIHQPFDVIMKSSTLEAYAKTFVGEWVVLVDADEFLELPYPSLRRTVNSLTSVGANELPARLMQRAHPEGVLASLKGCVSIDDLFSAYDYRLAERMNVPYPVWKNKYPLVRIGPTFRLARGFHMPTGGRPVAQVPIRAALHHFKWRDRLMRAVGRRRGAGSNQIEQDAYGAWLEAHDFRLPTEGLKKYSRAALLKEGYLMRATSRETAHYAALHDAAAAGQDSAARVAGYHDGADAHAAQQGALRVMARVPSALAQSDRRASGYLNRKHLAGRRGRIALVTSDLLGLRRTGGIGTAVSALAECLVAAGHQVDVFLAPYSDLPSSDETWIPYWEARGVHLRVFTRRNAQGQMATSQEMSLLLAATLVEDDWDVIHFPDAGGMGAASLLLRAAGIAFQATRFVVTLHGPTLWHRAGNLLPWAGYEAEVADLEKTSVALADVLVSPSRYMKEWCERHFPSPAPHLLIPNSLSGESRRFGRWPSARRAVAKVVFFGRLEQRKGLDWFLSAIEAVLAEGLSAFEVIFLGSPGSDSTLADLAQRTARWPCRVAVLTSHTSHEAVEYLRTESCLVVIPSRVDNSPYTVYECLENGIPFIASDVGGIGELIHPADRDRVTVSGGADEYAAHILDALHNGVAPARLSFDPALADVDLLSLHGALAKEAWSSRGASAPRARRDVTVVVHGTADPAPAILRVLERWAGDGVEILVDRHAPSTDSDGPPDMAGRNRAPVLNRLARAASGACILFCHTSVIPQLESLAAMRAALAASAADAVVGGYREVRPDGETDAVPTFAGPAELSTVTNIYGARMFLVRRVRFLQQGGFATEPGVADMVEREFLNRLHAGGGRIIAIPSPIASAIASQSAATLGEYQFGRLTAPWVEAAPESLRGFVRMALRPARDMGTGSRAAESTAPEQPLPDATPLTVTPAVVFQEGIAAGDAAFVAPTEVPMIGEHIEWELASQSDIGHFLIDRNGRLLRTREDGYAVRSREDSEGCDFLLADDVVSADDSRLLGDLFAAASGVDAKGPAGSRGNTFLRLEEMLERDAEVSAPLIDILRHASELTAGFYDLAALLYPIHGRITQIRAGTFVVPPLPIGLPRAVADHRSAPRFGGALWLNDEFTGGDSYFTALDISVTSRPRRYIGHTATRHHELATLRVTSGLMLIMSFVMSPSPDEMNPLLSRHF